MLSEIANVCLCDSHMQEGEKTPDYPNMSKGWFSLSRRNKQQLDAVQGIISHHSAALNEF